ncbi:MAG: hypothetical protein PF448_09680 [Bacteroidales bacterium]|jgi:hypothetical protein|nr:hypothetical protein [Bacteroidales bacterium]
MKKLIALLFVLSILFIACEDEPDEILETPVYAGIQHDQMMLCDTLNHEMEFNLDSTENWYYAYDSLDINFDNDFDLHFKLVFLDSTSKCNFLIYKFIKYIFRVVII